MTRGRPLAASLDALSLEELGFRDGQQVLPRFTKRNHRQNETDKNEIRIEPYAKSLIKSPLQVVVEASSQSAAVRL